MPVWTISALVLITKCLQGPSYSPNQRRRSWRKL